MAPRPEFAEIAHCGGKVNLTVRIDSEGRTSYQIGWTHCRPNAAALFAVYAIPQGVAVADLPIGGIGQTWPAPPIPNCYPVFISSDSDGMFGHECPSCKGYWRSSLGSVCPYCGYASAGSHDLLTAAQRRYVFEYCQKLTEALASEQAGVHTIDMDAVADAVGTAGDKPPFYYAEQSQQNLFTCTACGAKNDVLGTYAYCSICATRNDLAELRKTIDAIRVRINSGGSFEACLKDVVSGFDSYAARVSAQLVARVPLSASRKARLKDALFHNVKRAAELFRETFDINIFSGVSADDEAFIERSFFRRHVYEHNGGEADERYIARSGDDVKLKQALRETQESAHRVANVVLRMASNVDIGFHELFPPIDGPIKRHQGRKPKT